MCDWDNEGSALVKREELQSLGDGELSTVSQQNYALGLIV